MGLLAETKIRRKLQQDPNNTKWTRNENTFGQKILRSQGWQPGQFLGVQDSNHSELHTAASASYIRVSMKDDVKGLGFDRAVKDEEISGLDAFTDLLSRLNGKSAESVAEEQKARLVVKTHRFVEQRYGAMRFVRGGLLVGDELKADENDEKKKKEKEAASKKRKATSDEEDEEGDSSSSEAEPEVKKKRKTDQDVEKKSSKKRSADGSRDDTPSTETDSKAKRREKKSKKDKPASDASEEDGADDSEPSKSKKSKEERKEEKRLKKLRKAEKKEAKEAKKRRKAEAKASKSTSPDETSTEEATTTAEVTPVGSGTSTPRGNPHFVRSRFLKAKREAMLDGNAINKIFMVKA